jgi:hypothetical protein
MPLTTSFMPLAIGFGGSTECSIEGFPDRFRGESVQIDLRAIDSVAVMWVASLGASVDENCVATAEYSPELGRECVIETVRVSIPAPAGSDDPPRSWDAPDGLEAGRCYVGDAVTGSEAPDRAAARLMREQEARYRRRVGEETAAGTSEFEGLCFVERLLVRTPLRLPGVEIHPVNAANAGSSEVDVLNALLAALGWGTQLDASWWAAQSRSGRPWTVLRLPSIWAESAEGAAALARAERDITLHILALNRGSSGIPIATAIRPQTQPQEQIFYEIEGYTGNLIGGFISGESQHDLVYQEAAMRIDRVLALATKLYREARAERNPDSAYFRYWSLLEMLADARITAGRPVIRTDGTSWPPPHGTTDYACPKVYELLKNRLVGISEASVASPAADLYEATRGWYARRNATAHYGAFDASDPAQRRQHWFERAGATVVGAGKGIDREPWLEALRESVLIVVRRELHDVGAAASQKL